MWQEIGKQEAYMLAKPEEIPVKSSMKIAAFHLDYTLIKTKSGTLLI